MNVCVSWLLTTFKVGTSPKTRKFDNGADVCLSFPRLLVLQLFVNDFSNRLEGSDKNRPDYGQWGARGFEPVEAKDMLSVPL